MELSAIETVMIFLFGMGTGLALDVFITALFAIYKEREEKEIEDLHGE